MGIVIRMPLRHGRTPTGSRAEISAKAFKVISRKPRSSAKRASVNQCAEGIPLARQTLTVDGDSVKANATAFVPPRASITESGVIMERTIVCDLQTSQEFAHRKTTFSTRCDAMYPMADPREVVFGRLDALRIKLAAREPKERFDVEYRFAEAIGLHKTSWAQIKKFKRDLPITAAYRIKERWGLSLDWIYYGEQPGAAQIMAEIGRGPIVPVRQPQKRKIAS